MFWRTRWIARVPSEIKDSPTTKEGRIKRARESEWYGAMSRLENRRGTIRDILELYDWEEIGGRAREILEQIEVGSRQAMIDLNKKAPPSERHWTAQHAIEPRIETIYLAAKKRAQ